MSEKPLTMRDDLPPELRANLKRLLDNFLICIVKRNGGRLEFPVAEIDAANDLLEMEIDQDTGMFILKTEPRQ